MRILTFESGICPWLSQAVATSRRACSSDEEVKIERHAGGFCKTSGWMLLRPSVDFVGRFCKFSLSSVADSKPPFLCSDLEIWCVPFLCSDLEICCVFFCNASPIDG
ncbi:hypothetical protein QN277_005313 [Acacia crassicarpa]|uniref:Uncharacterized protein n=1 Tax=Acacia crassicarpa TaxID=499986 RepID=A0AAE1IWS5_9FABA|nr:hypothetical protein QN277_005313 [Acacia crassicarpa]